MAIITLLACIGCGDNSKAETMEPRRTSRNQERRIGVDTALTPWEWDMQLK